MFSWLYSGGCCIQEVVPSCLYQLCCWCSSIAVVTVGWSVCAWRITDIGTAGLATVTHVKKGWKMSESIESFWKEHEAVMTETTTNTERQSYWVIKEEEFFASHGLSSQHVKLIAGLGMCITGFLMTVFLIYLCSKLTRHSQVTELQTIRIMLN